jgi:hypothetical protein
MIKVVFAKEVSSLSSKMSVSPVVKYMCALCKTTLVFVRAEGEQLCWHSGVELRVNVRSAANIDTAVKEEHALPDPARCSAFFTMVASQMDTNSSGYIIHSEILSVTSVMRKHSRWSSSTHTFSAHANHLGLRQLGTNNTAVLQGSRGEDLISGFEKLKRTLRSTQGTRAMYFRRAEASLNVSLRLSSDVSSIPLTDILSPFLSIIRSPLSLGPITSAALSALHTFFARGLFLLSDPSVDVTLAEISSAISHCTFEACEASDEEVVLLRILTVIEDCMCGSWGPRLGDIEVCEMLETVLSACFQTRLSGQFFPFVPAICVFTGPQRFCDIPRNLRCTSSWKQSSRNYTISTLRVKRINCRTHNHREPTNPHHL